MTDTPAQDEVAAADEGVAASLPVSLGRIREGLARPADGGLKNLEMKPDFSVHIDEQRRIDEILKKMDFRSGPAPAGGLRAYEMQRMLFNPVDHPLQQPYAAFSGGELITVALENLIGKYLGPRIKDSITSAERAHADSAAKAEVSAAIADYCTARPDRLDIEICTRN